MAGVVFDPDQFILLRWMHPFQEILFGDGSFVDQQEHALSSYVSSYVQHWDGLVAKIADSFIVTLTRKTVQATIVCAGEECL